MSPVRAGRGDHLKVVYLLGFKSRDRYIYFTTLCSGAGELLLFLAPVRWHLFPVAAHL